MPQQILHPIGYLKWLKIQKAKKSLKNYFKK
jgi:hypothetical protein